MTGGNCIGSAPPAAVQPNQLVHRSLELVIKFDGPCRQTRRHWKIPKNTPARLGHAFVAGARPPYLRKLARSASPGRVCVWTGKNFGLNARTL
jgi:hypothetical protein